MRIDIMQHCTPSSFRRMTKIITPDCRIGNLLVLGEDIVDESGCFREEETGGEEGDSAVGKYAPGVNGRGKGSCGEEDEWEEGEGFHRVGLVLQLWGYMVG